MFVKRAFEGLRVWSSCIQLFASCVRASKRAHDVYKRVRTPLHGAYFCLGCFEVHSLLVVIPATLLVLTVVGWLIEENV